MWAQYASVSKEITLPEKVGNNIDDTFDSSDAADSFNDSVHSYKRRKQITLICFLISLISGRGVFCLAALGLLDKLFAEI